MGKASHTKHERNELVRRDIQAATAPHHRTGKPQSTRESRREKQRQGEVLLFDPRSAFKLDYKFSIPPGPLRDEHPVVVAGTLTAESECDILRGIFVKLASECGYTRPEFGRAVTGMFAEIVNPLSVSLRMMIATQIAQGTGLDIRVQEITSCVDCGAEQEIVDIMLPEDPGEATDDSNTFARQEDQTAHAPQCPTHPRPDTEAIAAFEADEELSEEATAIEIAALSKLPGKEVAWKTGPAVVILHPQKYQPLMQPSTPTETATEEISEETLNKVPDVLEPKDE